MDKQQRLVIRALCGGLVLAAAAGACAADPAASVTFTLKSNIGEKGMTFMGVGGGIDGVIDPDLKVPLGANVQIVLIDGEGAEHDIVIPAFGVKTKHVVGPGTKTDITFKADKTGDFEYFCDLPGHKAAGMVGKFTVATGK